MHGWNGNESCPYAGGPAAPPGCSFLSCCRYFCTGDRVNSRGCRASSPSAGTDPASFIHIDMSTSRASDELLHDLRRGDENHAGKTCRGSARYVRLQPECAHGRQTVVMIVTTILHKVKAAGAVDSRTIRRRVRSGRPNENAPVSDQGVTADQSTAATASISCLSIESPHGANRVRILRCGPRMLPARPRPSHRCRVRTPFRCTSFPLRGRPQSQQSCASTD